MTGRFCKNFIAALFWVLVWAIAAWAVDSPLLLPGPLSVFRRLLEMGKTASFWVTAGKTLLRILAGILCAVPAGILLAVATCRFSLFSILVSPLLTVIKSTPVASFILLLLIWLGRDLLPGAIVFLMVLPIVWSNVSAGVENTNRELLEMAKIYRLTPVSTLRNIYLPSVMPYFLAACRSALGLGWKAGVAAEVLSVPKPSIGQMLYESKLYLETTDLFAWTVVVILCSLLIEKPIVSALETLSHRYNTGGDCP